MEQFKVQVDDRGRVGLPLIWRKQQRVVTSSELYITVGEDGTLLIETRRQGLLRARRLLRQYVPAGYRLSEEIIADHRMEATRERQ